MSENRVRSVIDVTKHQGLASLPGFPFEVRTSESTREQAGLLADRCGRAYSYLGDKLAFRPRCALLVLDMTSPSGRPTDISVRQFVADSGAVTRGLRQGRAYTLTLNGEPLAKMIPIQRRRAIPKDEVLAIFAMAPVVDANELRADLDEAVSQDAHDPYEGTGL